MKYLLIILILCEIMFSQYAPLNEGNTWVYKNDSGKWEFNTIGKIKINMIEYYVVGIDSLRLREDRYYVSKEDNDFPMENHEQIYYKNGAKLNDYWITKFSNGHEGITTVVDTIKSVVYNKEVTLKFIEVNFGIVHRSEIWTDEFGLMWEGYKNDTFRSQIGCVIDGVVYGDTSLITGFEEIRQLPKTNVLYQNYPNPFNPTTLIKYQIPNASHVQIKLYNMLGQELKELVNKPLQAGYYEISFDGSDLPSSMYIYKITAGNFTDSKKMLLLK